MQNLVWRVFSCALTAILILPMAGFLVSSANSRVDGFHRNRNELLFARLKLPHASTSSHVYLNVFRGFEVSCFLMFITLEKESL